jgi:hypothetical protein
VSEPSVVLYSYAISVKRPNTLRSESRVRAEGTHIALNGSPVSLCGQRPVTFVGEVGMPDTEDWPRCEGCWRIAGPEVTSVWDGEHG